MSTDSTSDSSVDLVAEVMDDAFDERFSAAMDAQIEAELVGTSRCRRSQRRQRRSGRRRYIERNREAGHERLVADYFSNTPVYTDAMFRRRFRMRRPVFLRIVEALGEWSPLFCQRTDAINRRGFSPLQKCTAAMRMLAYGCSADSIDECLRIGQSTTIECLVHFVEGVKEILGPQYLRRPTPEDVDRLLQIGESRGFPGMLGSLDCMWEWKNCPVAWQGQFTRGDHGVVTIMLEAVASQDLWIWHAFFGVAGSNNDINVLNQSSLFTNVLKGRAPPVQFAVSGRQYNMGYYLVDGMYPKWAVFVKTIPLPQNDKDKLFARQQEGARKDVERAFGVLQSRFAILRGPARFWQRSILSKIMYACIIMHNMIVEDERDLYSVQYDFNEYDQGTDPIPPVVLTHGPIDGFTDLLERNASIRDRSKHRRLKKDLLSIFGIVLEMNRPTIRSII